MHILKQIHGARRRILPVLLTLALGVLGASGAWAADTTYNGTNPSLQSVITWPTNGQTLLPDTLANYTDQNISAGNTLTIDFSSGTNPTFVYGGYNYNNAASSNKVFFNQGTVEQRLYGAASAFGGVTGNEVTMSDGTLVGDGTGYVLGGFSYHGFSRN
jgi:hypothetical protein